MTTEPTPTTPEVAPMTDEQIDSYRRYAALDEILGPVGQKRLIGEIDRLRTERDTLRAENALLREVAQKAVVAMDSRPRLPDSMHDAYRALSRVFNPEAAE